MTAIDTGLARTDDPSTSHEAAASIDAANDCAIVLDALRSLPGQRGTTDDVLDRLRRTLPSRYWERNVVASRISQLKDEDRWEGDPPVVDTGCRKMGRANRPVIVWGAVA